MSTTTTNNPRVKRQQARKITEHRDKLLPAEQAVRFALDAFNAAGTKLVRAFQDYDHDKDSLKRFAEINEDLEVKVYGVQQWLTMVISLGHVLATAFLTCWFLYTIVDAELINSVGKGIDLLLGPGLGGFLCLVLSFFILANAARMKHLGEETKRILWTIAAYVTVCIVPLYAVVLSCFGVYEQDKPFWEILMFWAALVNLAFGVLFVIGGGDHWTGMSTFTALGRRAWARVKLNMSRSATENQQDRTRAKLSALRVEAGGMRHRIEDMRALGGVPRITMIGRLEAKFIDDHIYGEPVLLLNGTVTGNANMNDPAEFLPLLERLGDTREWMDVEEDEPASVTPEPEATTTSETGPDTPPDADSAFEPDPVRGQRADTHATGGVHPEDKYI